MTYTTAEQSLIAEVLYEQILEYMEDIDVSRRIFPVDVRDSGDSVKITKEGQWASAAIVAEGAEVPIYQPNYTQTTETYRKAGYRVELTHEMITDANWDLLRRAARKAGQKMGLKVSIDVLREAWGTAGVQTFTVSGRWGGANADEIGDITTCMGKVAQKNYFPDLLVVNPGDYAHLAGLDAFIDKSQAPNGKDIRKYEIGTLLGMDVISTNQMSENNFLMLDSEEAGKLFIREDLRYVPYEEPTRDVQGILLFMRYREATLAPSAILFATGFA